MPIILMGGVGNYSHIAKGFKLKIVMQSLLQIYLILWLMNLKW